MTRSDSLSKATKVRVAQRYLTDQIAAMMPDAGRLLVAEIVEKSAPDTPAGAMPVGRLLRAIHGLGDAKAKRAADAAGTTTVARLRDLTPARRADLAAWLRWTI